MNTVRLIIIVMLCISFNGISATFCVSDSSQFQQALNLAASNNQHDLIKVKIGEYDTPGTAFNYNETQGWDLEISGGWLDLPKIGTCGSQLSSNPMDTILSGENQNRVLEITTTQASDINISNLWFVSGNTTFTEVGGGLYIYSPSDDHFGHITIENNYFSHNEAYTGGAVAVFGGSLMVIRNNVLVINHSRSAYNVQLEQNNASGIYFTNNTVISNTTGISGTGGAHLVITGSSEAVVANNILWGNDHADLQLVGDGLHHLKSNNIGTKTGVTPHFEAGTLSLPPRFSGLLFDFTPSAISPMVNQGTKPCSICPNPIPFDQLWTIGEIDANGYDRVQHGQVDIGAVESPDMPDLIFMNGLD